MDTTSALLSFTSEPEPPSPASEPLVSETVGYIITLVACLLFGSCLLPAKRFYTGDGVFYQLMMNNVIIGTALIINIILGMPRFEPLVMISGAMWCTANLGTIITIRCIGLGIGMNIWSLITLLVGWAAGRFGFFGPPQVPRIEWLQYLGIAVAVVRGVLAGFITPAQRKPQASPSTQTASTSDNVTLRVDKTFSFSDVTLTAVRKLSRALSTADSAHVPPNEFQSVLAYVDATPQLRQMNYLELADVQPRSVSASASASVPDPEQLGSHTALGQKSQDFIDRLPLTKKRILGLCIAVVCGLALGLMFEPVTIMKQNGGSLSDKDYTLSLCAGAFCSSLFYSAVYIVAKGNRPFVDGRLILPAFAGGVMWSLGQIGRFISHEVLNQSVSYPIYAAVPSLISLLWGYFYFKEIKGRTNVILFVIVAVLTVFSVLMIAFSK